MDTQTSEPPSGKHTEVNAGKDISGKSTKPKSDNKKRGIDATVLVALIGAIGTIIVALLNSSLIEKWLFSTPTPTPTVTATLGESPAATESPVNIPTDTVAASTEDTPVAPLTFTPTVSEPQSGRMTAVLQTSTEEGKAPLKVNFDARASHVKLADGSLSDCGANRFCSYEFAIYHDGRLVEQAVNNDGTLSYTFGAKGEYFVTVYVCRGQDCCDEGVTITAR